jgi:hypothetical protein
LATAKHGQNYSICKSSLQIPLSAERERFMRPVSQVAMTIEGVVFIHILGNAVWGALGRMRRCWGGGHLLWDFFARTNDAMELGSNVNSVRVHSRDADMIMLMGRGGSSGHLYNTVFHLVAPNRLNAHCLQLCHCNALSNPLLP